jgi:hypothetical protein
VSFVVAALAVPLAAVTADAAAAQAVAVDAQRMVEVRPIDTSDLGAQHPAGIAYDPGSGALVVASGDGAATRGARVTPQDEDLGSIELPGGEPSTLTFDPRGNSFATIAGPDLRTAPGSGNRAGQARSLAPAGVATPAGAAFDASGTLFVLDASTREIVRVPAADPAQGVSRIALSSVTGADPLTGLAFDPTNGLLYVMDPGAQRLFGVDSGGTLQSVLDISALELTAPRAFAFAPSSDTTDDPSAMHLFVADAGDQNSSGQVMESTVQPEIVSAQATVPATLVQTIATSAWSPASPDPSGIEYVPGSDRLEIADSEVDEVTGAGYHDVNLWQVTRNGAVTDTGTTWTPAPGFSKEPSGLGYDAASKTFFISDDSADCIWVDHVGADTRVGTADDASSCIDTKQFSSFDPEDPEFDPTTGHLFYIDGVNTDVYELSAVDGIFGNGNDALVNQFDVGQYGPTDIEGLGQDAAHGTLLVGGRATKRIYEVTKTGALVTVIDATGIAGMRYISGLVQAPASDGSGRMDYWTVDRNLDNGGVPSENDGQLFELRVGGTVNSGPTAKAGPDQTIPSTQTSVNVSGTVTDDGLPNPPGITTSTWTQTSGPATVTFANASALATSASGFTAVGDYVLRLTANDGAVSAFDELIVHVTPATAGEFFPLAPSRILDTRVGNGAPLAKVTGGSSLNLQVTGRGGVPGSGAAAVVMNVTVTNPTVASHVTVWPTGSPKPTASNLNFVPGQTVPNLVTVGLGSGGKASLYVDAGSVDLIADVVGYYGDGSASGAKYQALSPSRILDSRNGTGGYSSPWSAGQTRDLSLPGAPAGATAVVLNVTETNPTAAGFATVWPSGIARPDPASNLNFVPGKTAPNLVVVPLGANGKVSLYNSAGSTDYIADLVGYYGPSATTRLTAVVPVRLLDSRVGTGGFSTPWAGGQTRDLTIAGVSSVPADAKAVVLNVTVTNPTASGHVIVWPSGVTRPNVSNLNFTPGQTVPNLVMVQVGANGKVSLYNSAGNTDLIADVVGYFR